MKDEQGNQFFGLFNDDQPMGFPFDRVIKKSEQDTADVERKIKLLQQVK